MIKESDEEMFRLWLCTPDKKMAEAFSIYRQILTGPDPDAEDYENRLVETFDDYMDENYD